MTSPAVTANTCPTQVFRLDRTDGSVDLVSRQAAAPGATPVAADAGAFAPAIVFDGSSVLFTTRSTNLFDQQGAPTADATGGNVVAAAVDAGTLTMVSVLGDGTTPGPLAQGAPRSSADGRVVVFETSAPSAFGATVADPASPHVALAWRPPQVSMASVDVGTVAVGLPSPTYYVGVLNTGPSQFVPASISSSNPDFAVIGGTCQLGVAVPAGGSCEVHVILTPSRGGPDDATLTVAESGFGASLVQTQLQGAGGVGALAALDAGHDFGTQRVGTTSAATTLRVGNTGLGAVELDGVSITGHDAFDFIVTATTCAGVLDVGQTCTVDVVFRPTTGGQRVADVHVSGTTGEYTAVLIAGSGEFASASLVTSSDHLVAGRRFGAGGWGFPANTALTLVWSDGTGGSYSATTNRDGAFLASFILRANERPGQRTLIVKTAKGPSASADVFVLPRR